MVKSEPFRELREKYERRVRVGTEDFEQTIGAYLALMAPRKILRCAVYLLGERLQACNALAAACKMPSRQFLTVLRVMLRAVRESNRLELQELALRWKGLVSDEPKTSSDEVEGGSVEAGPAAVTAAAPDCLENRRFLAYVSAVADDRLSKCVAIEADTGIPSLLGLRPISVLLQIVRELRKVELEDAIRRAKRLAHALRAGCR